jgi:hypothetical protein
MSRILTGIQSTGTPHLGNILGAILPAIALSNEADNDAFFFIANLHSLTQIKNAEELEIFQKFTKDVNEIFDKSIVNTNAWLMYGCRKNDGLVYKATKVLTLTDDEVLDQGVTCLGDQKKKIKMFSIQQKGWCAENAAPYSENYTDKIIDEEYEQLGFSKKSSTEEDFENLPEMKKQDIEKAKILLGLLSDKRASNYNDWMRVGWALHNIDRSLLDEWIEFSQRNPDKYKEGECEERWSGIVAADLSGQ